MKSILSTQQLSRIQKFKQDIGAVMKKHNAEIEITETDEDYGMGKPIAVVTMYGSMDENGDSIEEFVEFTTDFYNKV